MFIDIPPVQSAALLLWKLCSMPCYASLPIFSVFLLEEWVFSSSLLLYELPGMALLGFWMVRTWFGVVLVWMGLMGHQHGSYSGHILPTAVWIALILFALESPYSHLSLDSLNSPNGQPLAVFRLIQLGIAKTHIFRPFSARSLSLFTVLGLS